MDEALIDLIEKHTALMGEAMGDLIENRKSAKLRPHVMVAYHASHEKYSELYKKLAK